MSNFYVIDKIEIGHDGPVAKGPTGEDQLIHLSQGSMDGACGPYSLMMGLLICGLIDYDDLVSLKKIDGRTSPGKLLKNIEKFQGLFRNGTFIHELETMLKNSYPKKLETDSIEASGVEIRKTVKKYIDKNCPVILGLEFGDDDGHWVVAIGYEFYSNAPQTPRRLLLLDPSDPSPVITAWNGVVDAIGSKGRYPFVWWGHDRKAKLTSALALISK